MALDAHIKNVVSTYSLEHESIDELFDSVFDRLNVLLGGSENVAISRSCLLHRHHQDLHLPAHAERRRAGRYIFFYTFTVMLLG